MPSSWDGRIWCLKTIGFNACPACETDTSDALNPFVFYSCPASSWDGRIWCLKTIGFKACPAHETDGSDALKPLVFIPAQHVRRTDLMRLNHCFFLYSTIGTCWIPSAKEPMVDSQTDLFFAWRMQFIVNFLPFLASVCQWDKPSAHQPLVLLQTFSNGHFDVSPGNIIAWDSIRCLKTIGRNLWDSTGRLKTIGLKTNTSCETPQNALKPLVLRSDSPVRLGETEKHYINHWFFHRRNSWDSTKCLKTIGLKTNTSCETWQVALKPLVWGRTPVVRLDGMP